MNEENYFYIDNILHYKISDEESLQAKRQSKYILVPMSEFEQRFSIS